MVYTEGAHGGRFRRRSGEQGRWDAAPLPGPRVDAYGCGDSFAAGLTFGLGAGLELDEALALAARCGAACLTGRGPYGRRLGARDAALAGEVKGSAAMDFEQITTETSEGILTITLNRPERLNAWTGRMGEELRAAFDVSDADDEVRVVIITGAGRGFCAGADLEGGGDTFDYSKRDTAGIAGRDGGGEFTLRIFDSKKPVIAAINGPAVGVGATMTLPMDVRLAAEDAKLGFVFARRGIIPEACSSWFLPRVVGISRAMEWVSTGRVFTAQEGLEAGLIRSLHPKDELMGAARELALEIAENTAPVSVALARQLMWRMLGAEHPMMAHRADSRGMVARGQSADVVEGVTSFLEKRPAHFTDRVSDGLPDVMPELPDAPEFQ